MGEKNTLKHEWEIIQHVLQDSNVVFVWDIKLSPMSKPPALSKLSIVYAWERK